MEKKCVQLAENCAHLDIILLHRGSYDFMSAGKVDRLRKKEFNRMPLFHQAAFEKGIFKSAKTCFTEKFIPVKKR